jgi:phosphatidylglycerophosphatase A
MDIAGNPNQESIPFNRSDSMNFKKAFQRADFRGRTALIFSSWFGTGLLPMAPGTFGTLAAVPPVIIVNYLGALYSTIFLIALIPLSIWASRISQQLLEKDDPAEVVIDEAAGLLVAVFLIPFSLLGFIMAFFLFRVFDILKPYPIGIIDKRIKGGAGIVLDDIVAGIYANICLRIFMVFLGN